jgi:hypothetical protein
LSAKKQKVEQLKNRYFRRYRLCHIVGYALGCFISSIISASAWHAKNQPYSFNPKNREIYETTWFDITFALFIWALLGLCAVASFLISISLIISNSYSEHMFDVYRTEQRQQRIKKIRESALENQANE